MFEYVTQPSGPRAGLPFVPTNEQFRFILWWYAVDVAGMFVYRQGLLRCLMGWGKDPLAAALALAELCGPVDPHFGIGQLMVRPWSSAWIQVAPVSQEQTRN